MSWYTSAKFWSFVGGAAAAVAGTAVCKCRKSRELAVQAVAKGMQLQQGAAELPTKSGDVRFRVRPGATPGYPDVRRQLQIGGVGVMVQFVQKLFAVQPERAVEALEAASATDGAVTVVAGRDEEVHLLRTDYPLVREMPAADHALLAQFHQIPEEDSDLLLRTQMLPGNLGEAADAVGNGFYDVVKYQTKKVVIDKPQVNSGYVEKNGQTRSRRGSDGKIRTDRFYVTALVNEHDRLMIRSLERSVVNDSDVSEQVFDYAYKGLSPIKVEPADTSSRVNKNFVRCTIVAPDGSEFVFLLNDNAENDKLIEQINQKINDVNSKSA